MVAEATNSDLASHVLRGQRAEAAGLKGIALDAYRAALKVDRECRRTRQRLASLLVRSNHLEEAGTLLREELAADPGGLDWMQSELTAAMRQRSLDLAGRYARIFAEVRWGLPLSSGQSVTPTPSFPVSAAKLRHDADQFDYLAQRGSLPFNWRELASQYRSLADRIALRGADARVPLDSQELRALWPTYNRLLHVRATPRIGRAISDNWNARDVESEYLERPPGLVVVDEFLTAEALGELRQFCQESTVWFANRYGHGRLGAFFQDGFNCPLLLQIAEELREKLPRVIGDRYPLRQIWGFKNSPTLPANCTTHADFAAINVNFWITPDEANLKPDAGGMIIYDVDAPIHWDFDTYNGRSDVIRPFLEDQRARCAVVPYHQNRAIIFHSDLFHGTGEVCFRPEYEYRRINITLLYGDRECEVDHPTANRYGTFGAGQRAAWRSQAFSRVRR